MLRYQGRLCVPVVDGLRYRILEIAHGSHYSIYLGSTKMYYDLREVYWWEGLQKDIAKFVPKGPNCKQVKAEHKNPGGLLQQIQIPTWKWEHINMDFVVGFPQIQKSYNSIWVIVDRLTKYLILFPSSPHIQWKSMQRSSNMRLCVAMVFCYQ